MTTQTITGDHENRVTDYTTLVVSCGNGQLHNISLAEQSNPLDCMHDQQIILAVHPPSDKQRKYSIRRLTPTECARLQGFPDDWCEVPGRSDTAIYKAYGNSLAIPCAYDVLSRIADAITKTTENEPNKEE